MSVPLSQKPTRPGGGRPSRRTGALAAVLALGLLFILLTPLRGQAATTDRAAVSDPTGGAHLSAPVVGMAATPDGGGYWLVASDGGIFSYGDAHFYGSTGNIRLHKPIVGMAATPGGHGYWLVASDGGIFSYGDAHFYGSAGGSGLSSPVVGISAGRSAGGYRLATSAGTTYSYGTVRAAASGCQAGACVEADTVDPLGPASRVGQGFLHSLYPTGQEPQRLAALNTSAWRSSVYGPALAAANTSRWGLAESDGIPTTAIISDMWYTETGSGATAPWANWGNYRSWVQSKVLQILSAGYHVGYWEVYNEPDLLRSYYTPSVYATVTPQLLLQQFLVTYQAIRAADPSAQVIGPSLASFSATWTQRTFGLQDFLSFAAANHIQLAAVSWHVNTDRPQDIPAEVAQVRHLIAGLPSLGNPAIVINEYGTQGVQRIPGWDLAYLAALNTAGVTQANRSCWAGDCTRPVLDGLLAPDGTGTLPDYWLRLAYGQVSGERVQSSSSQAGVSPLAYYDGSTQRATVLVGRGVGCAQDPRCTPAVPDAAPESVRVTVRVPWATGSVAVTRSVIPGTAIAVTARPPSTTSVEAVTPAPGGGGTVAITLGSFSDGDAAVIGLSREG